MNFHLINKNKKYIIAVSGGPDSMFLLDNIFNNKKLKITNFYICHVNYQKRENSYIDQNIVINYCKIKKIKFFILIVTSDIYDKYYKYSHNFQAIARYIRNDFFLQISLKYNCQGILMGHNLTDNIETFLLQKKRKSIVKYYGLNKISWYFSIFLCKKIKILRIMLNISREKILFYLKKNNINYVLDYSNVLLIYNRNIIRNKLYIDQNKNKKIKKILKIIKQKNNKNKLLIQKMKNYFIKNINNNNILNLENFNKIKNKILKQMILYKYFEKNNLLNLINNKKQKFINEVIKQLLSLKIYIRININNNYYLFKQYKIIKIIKSNTFK